MMVWIAVGLTCLIVHARDKPNMPLPTGKCTRVLRNPSSKDISTTTIDSENSDMEENDGDLVFNMVRKNNNQRTTTAATISATLEKLTKDVTLPSLGGTLKKNSSLSSSSSTSSSSRNHQISLLPEKDKEVVEETSKITTVSKKELNNKYYDHQIKNFDPLAWRKQHVSNSVVVSTTEEVDEEVELKKHDGTTITLGHDDEDMDETCPLDISLCETTAIPRHLLPSSTKPIHNVPSSSSKNKTTTTTMTSIGNGSMTGSVSTVSHSTTPQRSVLLHPNVPLTTSKSSIEIDQDDDDKNGISDSDETCPLDISICETKEIPKEHMIQSLGLAKSKRLVGEKISTGLSTVPTQNHHPEIIHVDKENVPHEHDFQGNKRRKRVSFAGGGGGQNTVDENMIDHNVPAIMSVDALMSRPNVISTTTIPTSTSSSSLPVTITLNGKSYLQLNVLGKGGSSCVYRVLALNGGTDGSQLYAYKKVDVRGSGDDSDAVFDSYVNEINLLKKLKGSSPYIIDLVDAEINREDMYIAMVMEAGEIDLAKILSQKQRQAIVAITSSNKSCPPTTTITTSATSNHPHPTKLMNNTEMELLNPFFARMIWQEMLEAVDHIHTHRIVHGDLKPANFVFVKGHLKLIDFGIAKAFSNDTTNIYRESQIGTVNYMAPEAIAPYAPDHTENEHHTGAGQNNQGNHGIMSMRLGRASDVWSLGCILYQMVYGRPPFAALTTIQKLHAIPNPKFTINYPDQGNGHAVDPDAVGSIQACLVRDPRQRATIRPSLHPSSSSSSATTSSVNSLLTMPYLSLQSMQATRSVKHNHTTSSTISGHVSIEGCATTIPSPSFTTKTSYDMGSYNDSKEPWSKVNIRHIVDILVDSLQATTQSKGNNSVDQLLKKDMDRETLVNKVWHTLQEEGGSMDSLQNPAIVQDTKSKSKSRSKTDSSFSGNDRTVDALGSKGNIQCVDENKKEYKNASKIVVSSSATISIPSPPPPPIQSTSIPIASIPTAPTIATESLRTSTRRRGDMSNTMAHGKENENAAIVSKPSISTMKQQQQRPNFATEIANSVKQRDAILTATTTAAVSDDQKPLLNTTIPSSIRTTSSSVLRQPLRTLPVGLQEQIATTVHQSTKSTVHGTTVSSNSTLSGVNDNEETSRAKRWMKPKGQTPEKQDLKSVIEKRIGAMRKFLDEEQDHTATGTIQDFTTEGGGGNSFMGW